MNRKYSIANAARGFSLIEVLIAVVVLSTGLLALAALQGNLARASAEAKVRGRVAALLTARMDQLRVEGYYNIADAADDSCVATTGGDWVPAAFCTDIGIGSLIANQGMVEWAGAIGGSTFSPGTPGVNDPRFKRVTIDATWSDSSGADHKLSMSSDFSALAVASNLLPSPDEEGAKNLGPIVRQDNPASDGMIPIAIGDVGGDGDGDYTAATNPRPEIIGDKHNEKIVGTKFDVLTYSGTTTATIQKRFETEVIQCQCQYGVANDEQNGIRETPQWPAIWTGERYEVYEPDSDAAAPGAATPSGPKPNVDQSPMCTECCRDHQDGNASGVAKFDPERSGAHTHFASDGAGGLLPLANTTNTVYAEACRMIRVDGLWRTAADMYSRHFALLETTSVDGVEAKSGIPADSAIQGYESFVKDYLKAYDGTISTAPGNADTLFAATSLADTPTIDVATPDPDDYRYMHGRGLYVDYLEDEARTKISDVLTGKRALDKCLVGGADLADCVLPYLPFTTINVTELANWASDKLPVLVVHNKSSLEYFPLEPSRGRSYGDSVGVANADVVMGRSNAAVALAEPIDWDGTNAGTGDQIAAADSQAFEIGGTPDTGSGDDFYVKYAGLGTQTPNVQMSVDLVVNRDCFGAAAGVNADYRCSTDSTLSGQGGTIKLLDYWTLGGSVAVSKVWTCQGVTSSEAITVDVPTFQNWKISGASIKRYIDGSAVGVEVVGIPGSVLLDGTDSETQTFTLSQIPKDSVVDVSFAKEGSVVQATMDTDNCKLNPSGKKFTTIAWKESWAQ